MRFWPIPLVLALVLNLVELVARKGSSFVDRLWRRPPVAASRPAAAE
jgi:hypothetical protein